MRSIEGGGGTSEAIRGWTDPGLNALRAAQALYIQQHGELETLRGEILRLDREGAVLRRDVASLERRLDATREARAIERAEDDALRGEVYRALAAMIDDLAHAVEDTAGPAHARIEAVLEQARATARRLSDGQG